LSSVRSDEKSPQIKALEGLGLAATFLAFAMFCVFAPDFFEATGWQASAWFYAGAATAFLAIVGAATEFSRLTAKEAANDFGMGFGMLWAAAVLGITGWNHQSGLLKWLAIPIGFFGVYGIATGTAKASGSRKSRASGQRSSEGGSGKAIGVILGLLGLLTAAANLVGAVAKAS
jgi:hypothetical protein